MDTVSYFQELGIVCPEADECEEMLAKLCDIRLWIARRAAQDRTRAYQRQAKRRQRSATPLADAIAARKDAARGGPPEAA